MQDSDIIKALECCIQEIANCDNCPYEYYCNIHKNNMLEDTLDLITRQKAEIEELQLKNSELEEEKDNLIKTYKECMTEAIKEFAERLIELGTQEGAYEYVSVYDIDTLVKEMVGE